MLSMRTIIIAVFIAAALSSKPGTFRDSRIIPRCSVSTGRGMSLRLRGGADFKESVTGLVFSSEAISCGKSLKFVGAGERRKAIFGPIAVNVYAIGLYVDEAGAKEEAQAVGAGDDAASTIINGNFTKALRLIMARSVPADKIGDALADQIEPRTKGTDAPLEDFKSFFKGMASLDTKQEVVFTINGDTLHVTTPVGDTTFQSEPLCQALLHVYLGSEPVSPNGKAAMISGFNSLVST